MIKGRIYHKWGYLCFTFALLVAKQTSPIIYILFGSLYVAHKHQDLQTSPKQMASNSKCSQKIYPNSSALASSLTRSHCQIERKSSFRHFTKHLALQTQTLKTHMKWGDKCVETKYETHTPKEGCRGYLKKTTGNTKMQ